MIKLSNNATVIRCEIGYGRDGELRFIGKVLAYWNGEYVAWHTGSDNGITYSCFWGHYSDNEANAHEAYEAKFVGYGPTLLD